MKKLWICMLISGLLGFGTAWAINYQRFGHRVSFFGPFGTDNDLTPDGLEDYLDSLLPEGRPIAEMVNEPNHDFGMMAPDTEGNHTFVVKNTGNDDLRLRLGATTCKCTLGDLDREVLAPGEETEITLTWFVKAAGSKFSQSAEILTNDPKQVVIRLGITGQIIREVDIVPETWTFGAVATGEPMEVRGTIYSFLDTDIEPTEIKFSNDEMTALSEFEVEPFQPTEENDGIRSVARQGFRVVAKIKPGMRQGAVSQNLLFGFKRIDEDGNRVDLPGNAGEDEYVVAPTKGAIVGSLGMILNSKLSGIEGGGYLWTLGRIGPDDPKTEKAFVVLKGSERDNTNLSIGEVKPEGALKVSLGEPRGKGTMRLYPLEVELVPGEKAVERMGRDKDDYGSIWIESDNPKVTKMRIGVKFAIEAE